MAGSYDGLLQLRLLVTTAFQNDVADDIGH